MLGFHKPLDLPRGERETKLFAARLHSRKLYTFVRNVARQGKPLIRPYPAN